jgi:hypothetical protein
MTQMNRNGIGTVWMCVCLLLATAASAQQSARTVPQRDQAYDMSRETALTGTVVKYTESSSAPPLGAHATVQTSGGLVDVHLGNVRLLNANHFSLASGDNVRIVGENVASGKSLQFVARIIQKGNQTLVVRSTRGFPLAAIGKLGPRTEGGAL